MPTDGQEPTDGNEGQEPSANPQAGAANPKPELKAEAPQADADAKEQGEKKKLREEAAASRVRAKAAEDALAKLQDSLKTEDERRSEELKRLQLAEATWRDTERAHALDTAITKALIGSDALDIDIVEGLLKKANLDIEPDSGKPSADSLSAALQALKESKPFLFKQAPQAAQEAPKATSAGAGTNLPRKNATPLTREAINAMSTEDINRMWNEGTLAEALKGGGLNKRG